MADPALENYRFQRWILAVGAILMISKFVAFILTDSVAILTDALESIVNVVAGAIGLFALWLSARPADKNHPFGHGRVELISSTNEGALIAVAGALIIFESIDRFMNPQQVRDIDIGLVIVIIAAVVNYLMGSEAVKKGRKNGSAALEASGKHLCSDTYSSIGIILGLCLMYLASVMGYEALWLDPLLAMLFGVIIIITGARVIWKSFNEIMDRADVELLARIARDLSNNRRSEWIDVHHLRVLKYGNVIHVEMHVTFPSDFTIIQIEDSKSGIIEVMVKEFGEKVDVIIMPEPCRGFCCLHCSRECVNRTMDCIGAVIWNSDTLTQDMQQCIANAVVVRKKNDDD